VGGEVIPGIIKINVKVTGDDEFMRRGGKVKIAEDKD